MRGISAVILHKGEVVDERVRVFRRGMDAMPGRRLAIRIIRIRARPYCRPSFTLVKVAPTFVPMF
jgi:hypothetical protein